MDYKRQFNARTSVSKTAAYTATISDGEIKCSGTFSLTLFARSALTSGQSGYALVIINNGTGIISVVPATGETIADTNGYALAPGGEIIITYEFAKKNWYIKREFVVQSASTDNRVIVANTNGTTAVDVFGAGGAPHAGTITDVILTSLDTTAGNIIVTTADGTVCTIAKGTADTTLVGQSALANTAFAKGSAVQVDSSSAGDAAVKIFYSVGSVLD